MRKRILALLACGALAATSMVGLAGCGDNEGGGGGNGGKLTVWGPTEQQETLKTMVAEFKKANPDVKETIEVGVCAEGDAYATVSKDPSAAANVYAFANDQIVNLVRVGALAEIGGTYKTEIEATNGEGAVKAGQVNGSQYGYPYSADNGYFLYYDKSVVTDEDAATLEGLIAACTKEGKKIGWKIDDSWYTAGWFFAFGGSYKVEYNDDGTEKSVFCDFGTDAVGIKTAKAIAKLTTSAAYAGKGLSDDNLTGGIGDTMGAVVSGTWTASKIEEVLGDNYGVTKLPTVTVDGETKQLSSFAGYKLYGVNPHTPKAQLATAHRIAQFLSSEEMQVLRFENHKIGPSNTNAAASDAVKSNPALAALSEQNAFAVAQTAVPENFWEPVKGFGLAVMDGLADDAAIKEELAKMSALIVPAAVLSGVQLVGTINGWDPADRDTSRAFTKGADGKWTLEYTFDDAAEVKVVQVKSDGNQKWSDDANYAITEAGTYTFTYDVDTDKLTAVKK